MYTIKCHGTGNSQIELSPHCESVTPAVISITSFINTSASATPLPPPILTDMSLKTFLELISSSGLDEGPLRADADHGQPGWVPAGAVGIPPRAAVAVHDGGGRGPGEGGYGDTGGKIIKLYRVTILRGNNLLHLLT